MPATETTTTPSQSSDPLFLFNDEDFGDFEFATPISHSSSTTITTSIVFEDEEWGDFIEGRNNSNGNGLSTVPSSDPGKKVPTGAIPLSVFGEEDVEDADLENSRESDSKGSVFESYKLLESSVAMKGLAGVEIKDLVFGLYGQAEEEEKKKKVDSNGDAIKGSSSHEDFDEDNDDGGWEFQDAKSDTFNGEEFQVHENGMEDVLGQNSLLKTNDHKQVNGGMYLLHNTMNTLSDASQLPPSDLTSYNSFFDMKLDVEKDINLENRTSANLSNKDFSTPSRLSADDLFFYSSPSTKSTAGHGFVGEGFDDLIYDISGLPPELDNDNKVIGSYGNGLPPDLWTGNDKNDDYDDDSWEFKDAPSDMFSEHESRAKVHMKNVESFCLEPNIYNDNKDADDSLLLHDAFADVPGFFVGAVSNTDSVSKTSDTKINDESFGSPTIQTSANEDAVYSNSIPLKSNSELGNGSIIDLLDDLYGEANNLGAWRTGDHSNGGNAAAHIDYLADDDLDDNSWEFKDALPDLVTSESSQQDKDFSQLWENHVDKSSTSTVQNDKQEVDSLLNISDKHYSNPSSKIVDTRDVLAFDDVLFVEAGKSNYTEAGHNSTNVHDILSLSYEEKSRKTNNYLKSDFMDNEVNQSDPFLDAHDVTAKLSHERFLDFYSKLKEMSCVLVVRHLGDLKKDHELILLSGEEDKAMQLHQEIQTVQAKLQSKMASSDNISEGLTRNSSIHELLESIHKPYLHALEIEYCLTEKIFQAEKNLGSAVSLLDHSALMLHTLNAASCERQKAYLVAWSKLVSACAWELEHGAEIWTQCCLADSCSQIISETQGFKYFLALGEIYRVVEVLTVSLKIYKPWLLLNAAYLEILLISIKKCSNYWVNSGLEKAFQSSINLPDSKNKERSKSLLESIEIIRKLDPLSFQNHGCGQRESFCQLSLLPLQKLQDAGMEIVVWGGATYFVKLANLWANRISCEPPSLPPLKIG